MLAGIIKFSPVKKGCVVVVDVLAIPVIVPAASCTQPLAVEMTPGAPFIGVVLYHNSTPTEPLVPVSPAISVITIGDELVF